MKTVNKAFNYKLKKSESRKSRNKVYSNRHFGSSTYSTHLFYKNITRLFIPENEQ